MDPAGSLPPVRDKVAVVDIDGVLADVRHRLHHVDSSPKNWPAFFAAAPGDPLLVEGAAVASRLMEDYVVVYLTGRPESCRRDTERWLAQHALPDGRLLMRADTDRRPARRTKLDHLRRLSSTSDVVVLVDDDPEVIDAARSAGFPTLLADWVPRSAALAQAQDKDGRA